MEKDSGKHNHEFVPSGTFYGLDFTTKRDRNHGEGYHDHLIRRKDDKRCAIRITYDEQNVYVEEHGQGINVDLDTATKYIESHCLEDVLKHLSGFDKGDLAKPTSKARKISLKKDQKLY